MKTSPTLNNVSLSDVSSNNNVSTKGESLPNNGKAEAYIFLKNWINLYGSAMPKLSIFQKMKYYAFNVSIILFVTLIALSIAFMSVIAVVVVLGLLDYFFIDIAWWVYCIVSVFVFFSGAGSASVSIVEDFFDDNSLLKYREYTLNNIQAEGLERFVKRFGFSFISPNIKDLQKVQDFVLWQKRIAENFLPEEVFHEGKNVSKSVVVGFFDKKLEGLQKMFLEKKSFVKLTKSSVIATDTLIKNALKNEEFKSIYIVLQSGNIKFGDLTNENESRLMDLIKKTD